MVNVYVMTSFVPLFLTPKQFLGRVYSDYSEIG